MAQGALQRCDWGQAARSQTYFFLHVYTVCGQQVPEVSFEQEQIAIFSPYNPRLLLSTDTTVLSAS